MISQFEKLPMILILLFISSYSFGQKWSYQGYDKKEKFGHEYWFSFQNDEDSNSYQLTQVVSKEKTPTLSVNFLDFYGNPIEPTFFTIQNVANDSLIFAFATGGEDGKLAITSDTGIYKLRVRSITYYEFEILIHFKNNIHHNLIAYLGKAPELKVYQINSKRKLSNEKVESIIQCVKEGRKNNPNFGCEKKRKFYISIHI